MKIYQRLALVLTMFFAAQPLWASQEEGVSVNQPSPSPLGTSVVFSADYLGTNNLWISSLDGKALRRLTAGDDMEADPVWSPDGKTIVYTVRTNGNFDLWSIQADGTLPAVQLTSKSLNNKQPAWSPDGTRIAFISDRAGTNDLWIMNADGSSAKRLTTLPGQESHPSFSPAGDEIVFSETVSSNATLMAVKSDGSGLRTITPAGANDWNPNWSKYGIVFSSNRNNDHWKIWTVKGDGTGLTQLASNTSAIDPVWMPNGQILFSDEGSGTGALSAVSLLDPATGAKKVISTVAGYLTTIDVRSGRANKTINPRSEGSVKVAILSSNDFNAPQLVKQSTLTFGATGAEHSLTTCGRHPRDVNSDGLPDLICRFRIRASGFKVGDTVAILRFTDTNGVPREGRAAIVTAGGDSDKDDPDDFSND